MAKDVQRKSTEATPAYLELLRSRPAWMGVLRNGLQVECGEPTIFRDRAPTPAQRETLTKRADDLDALLSPSWDNEARKAVAMLIATLPAQGAEGATMAIRGDAYRTVLEDQPGWAVRLACRSYLFGTRKATFCPPPPLLRDAVLSEAAKLRQEAWEIRMILDARLIEPPAERKAQPDGLKWADVKPEDRVGHEPEPWTTPYSERFLKDLRARSPSLRAKLNGEAA